jgi:ATPase subunit of ABC transporter with duplicated ATPase domains
VRVGYLAQDVETVDGGSVLATVLDGFGEIRRMEEQLESSSTAWPSWPRATPSSKLQNAYGDLRHRFESLGGDKVEAKARMILSGLGCRRNGSTSR